MNDPAGPELHVWFATPEAAADIDLSTLDRAGREAWNRLRSDRRRRDWLASHVLSRAAGGETHALQSRTHSHGHAAVAFGDRGAALGVDLERLAPREFLELASIAYSPAEAAYLRSLDDPASRSAAFYELWTLKEACTKALGLHLVDGLRQCRFLDANQAWSPQIPTPRAWSASVYAPRPELRLALVWITGAAAESMPAVDVREWPGGVPVQWPLVRRLAGDGSRSPDAC